MSIQHPFKPVYTNNSKILVLGSFPSIKSRENEFYYGHPKNRFWEILENIFNANIPLSTKERIEFLNSHNIALWDIIKSCDILNSSDSSIRNVKINNIDEVINNSNIKAIFCNGNTSYKLTLKYYTNTFNLPIILLPSSSPANARFSIENLIAIWKEKIIKYI